LGGEKKGGENPKWTALYARLKFDSLEGGRGVVLVREISWDEN